MEPATSIDGNTGYFPSFEVLTNSKMESVGGNDSVNSSSSQQEQNSFDAGLSEAQDALLSIIEQQSNRSPDEYRSALVPFGEILRDIYETSNQTLNLSQQHNNDNPLITTTVSTNLIEESTNQQQPISSSTFHLPAPYQQQVQNNQGFSSNYNNANLMNYLNPFNNSFNFYQNYQQPNNNNTQFNSNYSTASISNSQNNNSNNENNNEQQQHHIQQQQNKYDDYNQNIETLIETVYEDENDQNPVYLNFNVSHDGNAATGTVIENSNDNHNIPIQNSNYSVEQLIYPGIYPAGAVPQHQGSSSYNNTTSVNGKLWYPESIINTGNCNMNNNENKFINRNINQQQNYIHPEYHHHRIQNNINNNIPIRKLSLLHSNQSAFDIYHRNGNNKTPYQKYNNKNKSFIDTTNYHNDLHNSINNGYLIKPKNYNHHQHHQQYVHEQFIPIGRNLQLQPNQKFITSDMISCRPPIQTKRTVAITNKQQQQSQQQQPFQQQQPQPQLLITPSSIVQPPESCNNNNCDNNNVGAVVGDGVVLKELPNVDISGIDFSSLDTSDIIIQKIQPKFGEPLHKKRKQDLKILDGSENFLFEFIDLGALQQQQQNDEIYNNNKLINDHQTDDIQIEKNLKNILNSSYSDEQDDDNNNNNNFQLNIIKSSTPSPDKVPFSKLKVKKNKINKENLKLSSSSHHQQHQQQQQTIANNNNNSNNIPYKKQKRTLLKKVTKIDCCFNNHDGETSSSAESDFEDMLLKNKSFKCNKCNKMFKSAKTLSTHRKRCNNNNNINITEEKKFEHEKIDDDILNKNNNNDNQEQHEEQHLKTIVSGGGFDSEHDDDPNSYPVEYLESDTELNDIKNQTINNNNTITNNTIGHNNNNIEEQQQIVKETIETDGLQSSNTEDNFRRKTRSQTKRKTVDLNYYEPSQKYPAKRKK